MQVFGQPHIDAPDAGQKLLNRENEFIKSNDDDISFMKSIVLNMKDAVKIDYEEVLESYTMSPEDQFEHIMILCTANEYIMLYWNTTA